MSHSNHCHETRITVCWALLTLLLLGNMQSQRRVQGDSSSHLNGMQLLRTPGVFILVPQEWQDKRTYAGTPVLYGQTGQPPSLKLVRAGWKGPNRPPAPLTAANFTKCSAVGNCCLLLPPGLILSLPIHRWILIFTGTTQSKILFDVPGKTNPTGLRHEWRN